MTRKDKPLSAFAKNLRAARKMKGWSCKGAANAIGIGEKRYSSYEECRAEPPLEVLETILKVYEVPEETVPTFLFGENKAA